MNKKGLHWLVGLSLILGIVVSIITIINFIDNDDEKNLPKTTGNSIIELPEQTETKSSFDISQVSIEYIIPIRKNLYSNSSNVVCYKFNNPNDKIDSLFTLHNEWFLDNTKIPDNFTTELNYEEVFDLIRYDWKSIGDNSKIKFRVGLELNKKPLFKDIKYDLIKNEEFIDYLKKEGNDIVWDSNLIRELINGTEKSICGKTDEEQTNLILSFVRENINPPLETIQTIYYNENQINSKDSWTEKIGTSSEYSYVLVSLLRSIGFPSKIETNRFDDYDYYYVKVYLQDKGWIPIDVFDEGNENKKLGEYFVLDEFKKDIEYKDISIPGLSDYIVFNRFLTHKDHWNLPTNEYTVTNTFGKDMKSYCIEVFMDYYDKENNLLYSDSDNNFLLSGKGLTREGTESFEFHNWNFEGDFDYIKIRLKEFDSNCN